MEWFKFMPHTAWVILRKHDSDLAGDYIDLMYAYWKAGCKMSWEDAELMFSPQIMKRLLKLRAVKKTKSRSPNVKVPYCDQLQNKNATFQQKKRSRKKSATSQPPSNGDFSYKTRQDKRRQEKRRQDKTRRAPAREVDGRTDFNLKEDYETIKTQFFVTQATALHFDAALTKAVNHYQRTGWTDKGGNPIRNPVGAIIQFIANEGIKRKTT